MYSYFLVIIDKYSYCVNADIPGKGSQLSQKCPSNMGHLFIYSSTQGFVIYARVHFIYERMTNIMIVSISFMKE